MKVKTLSALAGVGAAMILSGSSQAAFTGLSVSLVPVGGAGAPPAGGPRIIYNVFANFSVSTDRLISWGAGGNLGGADGSVWLQNLNAAGSGPGAGFTNVGGPVNPAPYSPGSTRDWDSYGSVGVRYGNQAPGAADQTIYTPGFPNIASGTSSTIPVGGFAATVTPTDGQGLASNVNSGADTNLRVFMMQLVVNAGDNVAGTVGVAWATNTGPATVVASQTFSSVVPAPGALALLGVAGLVGRRRRRA